MVNRSKEDSTDTSIDADTLKLQTNHYPIVRRAKQQFHIEHDSQKLQRGIIRVQSQAQTAIEQLDYLESRLTKTYEDQNWNHDTTRNGADAEIEKEFENASSRRALVGNQYTTCPLCEVKCLRSFLQDHLLICSKVKGLNAQGSNRNLDRRNDNVSNKDNNLDEQQDEQESLENAITVCPQPPRKLQIDEIGHDFIELSWDLPILIGGEPIIDYEILFKSPMMKNATTHSSRPRSRAQLKLHRESCCRWCINDPIPSKSFRLDGLEAATKYFNIKIRCKNRVGWSQYSNTIESVETAEPMAPSAPQTFQVCTIGSTFIDLSWSIPFELGGGRLKEYEFEYDETVPNDHQLAGSEREETKLERRLVKIPGDRLFFRIDELVGDCQLLNLKLRVINHFGLQSGYVEFNDVKTLPLSKADRIRTELERVQHIDEDFIDSDFFQAGVVQREEKDAYIQKLETSLRVELDCLGEDDTSTTSGNNLDDADQICKQSAKSPSIEPTFRLKQTQYEYRINRLKEDIKDCQRIQHEHYARRSYLTFQMAHLQDRIVIVKAELIVALECKDDTIVSNILNNTPQIFFTVDLVEILRREVKESSEKIAMWKTEIVQGDKKCSTLTSLAQNKEEQLKERIASFQLFRKQLQSATNLRLKTSQNALDVLKPYFTQLSVHLHHQRRARRLISLLDRIYPRLSLAIAICKWKEYRLGVIVDRAENKADDISRSGKGHILLRKAQKDRQAILDDILQTMKSICDFKSTSLRDEIDDFTNFDEHLKIRDLPELFQQSIRKGDFYHDTTQFEQAKENYEHARNILLEDLPTSIPEKTVIEVRCLLDVKISRSCIKSKSWNSALLYLDSLLWTGEKLQSNEVRAIAYVNLGECYTNCKEFKFAIDNFLKAIPFCKRIENTLLEARTHNGLHFCYEEIGDEVRSSHTKQSFELLTNSKARDISDTLNSAESMKQSLCQLTAHNVFVVNLQKASSRYVEVTKEKSRLEEDRRSKVLKLNEMRNEEEKLERLSSQIYDEIKKAKSSRKRRISSSLLHDSLQKFELNEFLKRLSDLLDTTRNNLKDTTEIVEDTNVDIKNIDDDLNELEDDLKLEQGSLMQKVLTERHIRCMSFNWSNIVNNNLSGKILNKFKGFVCSINKDLYVHNMENGQLEQVLLGDEEGVHIGEVNGHTSIVTALFVSGTFAYSGSADKTIMCWNLKTGCREYIARGHNGMITCIFVEEEKMVSGSADTSIILWNSLTGVLLKQVHGHSRGVLSLQCGMEWCVSGDADGEIHVWDKRFEIKRRLKLKQRHKITAFKRGSNEIITGDSSGEISIWFVKTSDLVNSCKAHDGPVNDLYFDATKLVSCGMDSLVKIIDVTTCQVLHTLRGHQGPILCIAFDNQMILTASKDWTLRRWMWNNDEALITGKDERDYKIQKERAKDSRKLEISRKTWANGIMGEDAEDNRIQRAPSSTKEPQILSLNQGLNSLNRWDSTKESSSIPLDAGSLASRLAK